MLAAPSINDLTRDLRKDPSSPLFDDESLKDLLVDEDEDEDVGGGGIRCPRCAWTPKATDRWMCGCGHSWNTFDTGGRCPSCSRQWHETQCLSCGAWSPHVAWHSEEPSA